MTVIAVIAIIAGLAIPALHYFTGSADRATAKLMAQHLSTTYMTALAKGHDFADGETEADVVVGKVVNGTTVGETYIGLPNVSAETQADALAYLELRTGRLLYKPQ